MFLHLEKMYKNIRRFSWKKKHTEKFDDQTISGKIEKKLIFYKIILSNILDQNAMIVKPVFNFNIYICVPYKVDLFLFIDSPPFKEQY